MIALNIKLSSFKYKGSVENQNFTVKEMANHMLYGDRLYFPGFHRFTYTLGIESHILQSNITHVLLSLVVFFTILQKGLPDKEAEICIDEDEKLKSFLITYYSVVIFGARESRLLLAILTI